MKKRRHIVPSVPGFTSLFKGGYAQVFREDATGLVCKRLEKFAAAADEDGLANYSTMVDIIFMKSLRPLDGTPNVVDVQHGPRYVDVYMKHHGATLTQWMRKTEAPERARHAPHILHALWSIIMQMYCNGCMHTDVKPCNILIEAPPDGGDVAVTLIDYNCMTVVDATPAGFKYAPAVGTWSHAAPEVVFHEQPYPQSPSWSLALVAVALYDRYPISPRLTHDPQGFWYTDNKSWRRIYNALMEAHPGGLPLAASLEAAMGKPLFECVKQSLRWRPEERPLLKKWSPGAVPTPAPVWHVLDRTVDPTTVAPDVRAAAVGRMYQLSAACTKPTWFCHAVTLYDACSKKLKERHPAGCLAAACWSIAGYLHNDYVADDAATGKMLAELLPGGETGRELTRLVYQVGEDQAYRCWLKPVDVRLMERVGAARPTSLEWLRDQWLAVDRPYTLQILAERWARMIV